MCSDISSVLLPKLETKSKRYIPNHFENSLYLGGSVLYSITTNQEYCEYKYA